MVYRAQWYYFRIEGHFIIETKRYNTLSFWLVLSFVFKFHLCSLHINIFDFPGKIRNQPPVILFFSSKMAVILLSWWNLQNVRNVKILFIMILYVWALIQI